MVSIYDLPPEMVDMILLNLGFRDTVSCYRAARLFHVVSRPRMQWLRYANTPIGTIMRYNLLEGLKYKVEQLDQKSLLKDETTLRYAILFNRKDIVDYLLENGSKAYSKNVNYAVQHGHLDLIDHLLKRWSLQFDIYTPFHAVTYCEVEELERLREMGVQYNDDCVDVAIKRERYNIVPYLYSQGLRAKSAIDAGRLGDIPTIKLLLQHGASNKGLALNLAARGGHLGAVKLLYTEGALGSEFSLQQAARYDHLETVRYLHFIGIPTKMFTTFDFALRGGSLKVCKQLMAFGLFCSKSGVIEVAKHGDVEILKYIHEKQRPFFHALELNPLDVAATYGHLEAVQYLVTQGYKVHGIVVNQIENEEAIFKAIFLT